MRFVYHYWLLWSEIDCVNSFQGETIHVFSPDKSPADGSCIIVSFIAFSVCLFLYFHETLA